MLQQSTCSTVLGGAECASSCARTLGCRAWRLRANECCLGLEALGDEGGDGPSSSSRWSARGEVLHPCERGCLAFGQPSISNVSLDDVPWLRVLHQLETPLVAPEPEPEPEPESSAGSAGAAGSARSAGAAKTADLGRSPRVAVCLAGQARSLVEPAVWHLTLNLTLTLFLALTLTLTLTLTLPLPLPLALTLALAPNQARSLVEPAVWHSIRDLLLERGRHALFMVLTLTLTLTSSS